MLKRCRNSIAGKFAVLMLALAFVHPLALASDKGDKNSGETPAEKRSATNPPASAPASVALNEIVRRLEKAEASAAEARDAAAAANARAADLERRLLETEKELQQFKDQTANAKPAKNSGAQDGKGQAAKPGSEGA